MDFTAAPLSPKSPEELAAEPIGYWSGEAHRRVSIALRSAIRGVGLSQPQWWVLNHLDGPEALSRRDLVTRLEPFNAQGEGRDLAAELEDLVDREFAIESAGEVLRLSERGVEALQGARRTMRGAHLAMTAGVSDSAYADAIRVLMQIVANLGGVTDV